MCFSDAFNVYTVNIEFLLGCEIVLNKASNLFV